MEGAQTFANSSNKRRREARNKKNKALLVVLSATLAAWQMEVRVASVVIFNFQNKFESQKLRSAGRAHYLSTLTMGKDEECTSQLRLNKKSFDYLCELLRVRGLLKDSRQVTIEEEVAACLHILAHAVKNRTITLRFMRSGEIVSKYFHGVLNAILTLSPNLIPQSGQYTPREPTHFEDCMGAIDGTHISTFLPLQSQPFFRNRKGTLPQNFLAACSFDLKFQYVLPGWEGSATDARVLHNALSRVDPLVVPLGCYYLVDAGLANAPRFLAPYCGHPVSFEGPKNAKELFNKRHSQARNVIEKAFGLLKGYFAFLWTAPQYEFRHQVSIVHVCCTLHYYILHQNQGSSPDGDEMEASKTCETNITYELAYEIDLVNVFRPYTAREG